MEIRKGRGYEYRIECHLIWSTRSRKPVLLGEIAAGLRTVLEDIALQNTLLILNTDIQPDHVHLHLSANPQHSIPSFLKAFKGSSARRMFVTSPQLKETFDDGSLWNPSYLVTTGSEDLQATITRYLGTLDGSGQA
jgi:putative transposase